MSRIFNNQSEYEKFDKSLCDLFGLEHQPISDFNPSQFTIMEKGFSPPPWNAGTFLSEEHKQNISNSCIGRIWTDERNEKVSEAKSKHWSDENSIYNSKEFREKQSIKGKSAKKHMMKPIEARHNDGTTLKTESTTQMCNLLGYKYTTIKRILSGKRKTHKGWTFSYIEEK